MRRVRPLLVSLVMVLATGTPFALAAPAGVPTGAPVPSEPPAPSDCLVPGGDRAPADPAACRLQPPIHSSLEDPTGGETHAGVASAPSLQADEGPLDCAFPGDARCETWVGTHDVAQYDRTMHSMASPSGDRVFVTGINWTLPAAQNDIITAAFDGETGAKLWSARYDGPAGNQDVPYKVVVSPDGQTVVAIGARDNIDGSFNDGTAFVAVAYDAATGEERWVGAYDSGRYDFGTDAAFAPDGSTLYMVGISRGLTAPEYDFDHLTVAFDAATGETLWATRNGSALGGYDYGLGIAVSPDGETVATTGWWQVSSSFTYGYGTTVYDTVDDEDAGRTPGQILWTGIWGEGDRAGWGIQFAPDSSVLYVTGTAEYAFGTVAYEVATGNELWSDRYDTCSLCEAISLDVLPGGDVVVTGHGGMPAPPPNLQGAARRFITLRYDGAAGTRAWTSVHEWAVISGRFNMVVPVVTSAPDGSRVYVAGITQLLGGTTEGSVPTTIALDPEDGTVLWDARYGPPTTPNTANPTWPSITAAGGKVFVGVDTREPSLMPWDRDFMVLAYEGRPLADSRAGVPSTTR